MIMPRHGLAIGGLVLGVLSLAGGAGSAPENVHRIVMKAADYNPQQIRAHVGDVVEWENQDIVAHTATAADKTWDVNLMPGRSGRIVMQRPGTTNYICRYHPNMKGEILVEP